MTKYTIKYEAEDYYVEDEWPDLDGTKIFTNKDAVIMHLLLVIKANCLFDPIYKVIE
tara:strand:+ start:605 stop:775 length:171 start_codon:yes stop_codon:yes gene_type:complete